MQSRPKSVDQGDESSLHDFSVVDSTVLLDAPIIAVRRDRVVMPGGTIANREIVEHFGAVAVVAYKDGKIAMVKQWRQCVRRRLWELPAGILDIAGEDPLVCARRELAEEAGLAAEKWNLLTDIVSSPGFCEEAVRIYLAQDITVDSRPTGDDDEEADMSLRWVDLDTAVEWVAQGRVVNSIAIAGILLAQRAIDSGTARDVDEPFELRPTSLPKRRCCAVGEDMKKR